MVDFVPKIRDMKFSEPVGWRTHRDSNTGYKLRKLM